MKETVSIMFNDSLLKCDIDFDYSPHVPAVLNQLPENCSEEQHEEFTINEFILTSDGSDFSSLIDAFQADIEQAIHEKWEHDQEPPDL